MLALLADAEQTGQLADEDRDRLAGWSSWGALPQIFDESDDRWTSERAQLRGLLDVDAWDAARRTTINAHYTHPAITRQIWRLAEQLGFNGGEVLEPGAGAGAFLADAPTHAHVTAVELDPTSARICALRFPQATVRAESFAVSPFADGSFDLTVGNVPFADVRLYDPRHNLARLSLHNHFLLKSLALTRPGGLVVALTSRYTLDARTPTARRALYELGDLVGAVRLPSGAHRRMAGTEAVTDLLVLRRRPADEPPRDDRWLSTTSLAVGDEAVDVNTLFAEHPEWMLGTPRVGRGLYSSTDLLIDPGEDLEALPEQLAEQLAAIAAHAAAESLRMTPGQAVGPDARPQPRRSAPARSERWSGHIAAAEHGEFSVLVNGTAQPLAVPRTQRVELRALLDLRDQARALLDAEASDPSDSPELDAQRSRLRAAYSTYHARYGPINRYTLRPTGRTDPGSGEAVMARSQPPVMSVLRRDPFGPLVMALERFEDSTQHASPAQLLTERALAPPPPRLGADTPSDALAICLDQRGRVDLAHVARLLGRSIPDTRAELGELVYHDPAADQLVVAAEYLSGDVRTKLDLARIAAADDPALQVNVAALERVVPDPLGPEDVEATLGAAWIDADTHQQFLRETFQDDGLVVEHAPGTTMWAVKGQTSSFLAREQWGTARMSGPLIARHCLEQLPIRITDEIDGPDGSTRRVLNPVETTAAQEKASQLQDRFGEWLWEDSDRREQLLDNYNRRFNSIVLRDYTGAGQLMALPGLAASFQAREHQRAAVARILAEPAVGLFHQVGAGKTAVMVIGAQELRRLGLVRKPCVVVPNHMLEQFTREWLQLYPRARILAASTRDLTGDARRMFVARAAADDWDAIVMTQTAFERISVTPETERGYLTRQVSDLRAALEASERGSGLTVKRLERTVLRLEEQLARLRDVDVDPGVCFEHTGIDYLIVDEAHHYKNLQTASNIPSASIEGSKRATDLQIKLDLLRDRHHGRVGTLATATPIANSITEAHVMQRYLRPDLLQNAGVLAFDAWAATFGRTVTELELAPTGGGNYRIATRFSRFQNVPEMLRMFRVFADVKTAEDLDLPTPALALRPDGQRGPQTVVIDPSPELESYLQRLSDRAEAVRGGAVDPTEDNMLLITSDGRKAALDMRLVADGQPATGTDKLTVAADRIAAIHHANADNGYLDSDGAPSQRRGALQIVFCDLSTPDRERWNAYEQLRDHLVDRGVPADQVRFIHEARTDPDKARLFAAARAGEISVLIGSTAKMGVGTNIQARAVALHHLDCPWRPADIEQRDGRAIRQGNQNPEVGIYRYAVERSFDSYSWQTVERKAGFIAQVMRGRLDVRSVEDIADSALSYSEVKALASGDPLILDKAQADAERTRLGRLHNAWSRSQQSLRGRIVGLEDQLDSTQLRRGALNGLLPQVTEIRGDAFAMTVAGRSTQDRAQAAAMIAQWAHHAARDRRVQPLGELAGLPLDGRVAYDAVRGAQVLSVAVHDLPGDPATLTLSQLREDPTSIIRQLEARVRDLPSLGDRLDAREASVNDALAQARSALTQPFKYADELADATDRCQAIADQMSARAQPAAAVAASDGEPDSQRDPEQHRPPSHRRYEHAPHADPPPRRSRTPGRRR